MKCTKCKNDIENGIRFCPSCGTACSTAVSPNGDAGQPTSPAALVYPKNPPLSPHLCWVNLALGGLAQIIYGQGAKGLTILAVQIFSNLVLPLVLALLIGAISIYDAYLVGKALKMGKTLTKWQWFPS